MVKWNNYAKVSRHTQKRHYIVFGCQNALGVAWAWRKSQGWASKSASGVGFPISLMPEHSIPCSLLVRQERGVGTWVVMLHELIRISSPSSVCRLQAQPGTGHRGSRGGEGKGLQAEPGGRFCLALPCQPQRIVSRCLRGACHVLEIARVPCSVSHTS